MKNNLSRTNQVSICDKNQNCFNAYGKNADLITYVVAIVLALIGASYAFKRFSK